MPTEIKAIKCPQCGSTENTELGQNRFKCKNCGTEYFLDGDNVTAESTINTNSSNTAPIFSVKKKSRIGCGTIYGILVALVAIIFIIADNFPWGIGNGIKGDNIELSELVVVKGKPYILILSDKFNGHTDTYFAFMDAVSGKIVKNEKFPVNNVNDAKYTALSNGATYLVFNRKVFEVDRDNMDIIDLTSAMSNEDALYASGIASIGIGNNYFQVMTNTGQNYFYYPIVKKSYPLSKIDSAANQVLPNAKDTVLFIINNSQLMTNARAGNARDTTIINYDTIKLLKIIYKYNNGDAQNVYGFISPPFFISQTDLTPGRLYFSPEIVYQDANNLLITVRATAAADAPTNLQRINTQNGALMWNMPLSEDELPEYNNSNIIHTNGKFLIKSDYRHFILMDDNGNILRKIDLYKK